MIPCPKTAMFIGTKFSGSEKGKQRRSLALLRLVLVFCVIVRDTSSGLFP